MQLMGREAEVALVHARLADRRLVTIVGVGGVGKTSLADEVATQAEERFGHGYRRVDLTSAREDGEVYSALAGQMGYPGFEELLDSPLEGTVLLVIDNCEHLVDAAADAVGRLLDAVPTATILATSRRPLDLPGETVLHLGPLGLPPAQQVDLDAPAARLFRARVVEAGIDPESLDPAAVCELCRQLDGNPLALEIAAARVRSLSPREILDLISDRLDVLHRPRYRGARRHRGLRAAIDWSYDLLSEDQQDLLDRLGALHGPFDAEMARAVMGRGPEESLATLDQLDALVADSLLVADVSQTPSAYRLLESVRTYAHERLIERQLLATSLDRIVEHLILEAVAIVRDSVERWDGDVVQRLLRLYPNVAAGIRWCVAHDAGPERAEVLAAVLWGVVHQSHTGEISELAGAVLDRWPGEAGRLRADVVATRATGLYLLGQAEAARALAVEQLDVADGQRRRMASVTLRSLMAQIAGGEGQVALSRSIFAEVAEVARENDLQALALGADADVALLEGALGSPEIALDIAGRAAASSGEVGSTLTDLWARSVEACVLLDADPGAALARSLQVADESRHVEYLSGVMINLRTAALAHASQGRPMEAAELALDLIDHLVTHGILNELRLVLDTVIATLAAAERLDRVGDLMATHDELPVVSMVALQLQSLVPVPSHAGVALPRSEAIEVSRSELRQIVEEPDGSADDRPSADSRPGGTVTQAIFRPVGEFFEVGLGARTAHLKKSKGLADLHALLARPGTEIHCLELAGAGVDESETGPALDAQARRAYEARIIELQAELDDADVSNDVGRSEQASAELDALVEQLSSALGLGGRNRAAGGTAERARSAVTQRIRSAIRRVVAVEPGAGEHLKANVTTGQWCVYRPAVVPEWELGP